jgi:tetratricopeptide (TPR) repeat protein
MIVRRLCSAVALTAGLSVAALGQTPTPPTTTPPTATPPATTPPAASTPPSAAPVSNPDIEKGIEALRKSPPDIDGPDGALKHFKDACDKDKKLAPPKIILAEILYQTNNAKAARAILEQFGAEDPEHPDAFLLSGRVAAAEGRVMDAMLCFETALAKSGNPRWPIEQRPRWVRTSREGLAQCYGSRNNLQGAIDQIKAILLDEPKNAVIRWQLARLYFMGGQPQLALPELETAFADDPKNPQIGLPEVNMGRFWDAKPITAKTDATKAAEEAENKKQAEDWMKKALEKHAKDVRAPREYGRWLLNQINRLDDADKQLATAKALDATDNETQALMGLSLRYKKKFGEAEKLFDDLNRKERANIFYAWNLALCMAESPDETTRKSGISVAEVVHAAQRNNPEAMSVLAWCYFKADRKTDADSMMAQALQSGGGGVPPDTLYFLANILEWKGKGAEARDALKKAIDSKAAFVYRKDAEEMYKRLLAKFPEEKKDEKKDKDENKKP